jgi:RNA polymerase primary sigma factor
MATHLVYDGESESTHVSDELASGGEREIGGAAERAAAAGCRRRMGVRRGERDSLLSQYLQDISAYPLLSRDEEVALARRSRAGDQDALDRLVRSNLRFVVTIAKRYRHRSVSLPDLINEGNLGLIRAARRFDETKGIKFVSYAVWWIRQAILQALAEQGHIMRVPLNRAGAVHRIGKCASALRQQLGREPTHAEIAAELALSREEIAAALSAARAPLSFDAPRAPGEDNPLADYLADDGAPPPDEYGVERALAAALQESLLRLKEREVTILRLYFGLDGEEPMSLERIGATLGITRERVRQIKEKALARLRAGRLGKALADFY